MPTVNIFYENSRKEPLLKNLSGRLKAFIAQELTCNNIKLGPREVSIRLLRVNGDMIATVEVEITAYSFKERVKRQDEICLRIADYIKQEEPRLGEVKVWLLLTELGHSWKE